MYDIKKAIKAKGVTLRYVAQQLDIQPATLTQQINENTIAVRRVQQIADIIGCPLTELVADDEDNNHVSVVCPHCGKPIKLTISHD